MYELNQVAKNTYYIDCPAKMGLYRVNETDVWLIDSGNDKEAGKKVQKILNANGWTLKVIINTHSNADHIGGNHLLQERTGCSIYAPGIEAAFTRFPVLEPSFLYGGYPCKTLRNKFLMAQPSETHDLTELELPAGMEIFPLKGHFFDMIGVKTPDNVYFLADCFSGENVIEKYHVSFVYDVAEYLHTLDFVEKLEGTFFVPAHSNAAPDIRPTVQANRRKVLEILETLLELCQRPISAEDVVKAVFDHYGLQMDFNQYVLVGSTVRSYLSYLLDQEKLRADFVENRLVWSII